MVEWLLIGVLCVTARADEPAAAPPEPLRAPQLLGEITPEYPPEAAGTSAVVTVRLRVDAAGVVVDAAVGPDVAPMFATSALNAARQLRFVPASRAGVPEAVDLEVRFTFAPPTGARDDAASDDEPGATVVVTDRRNKAPHLAAETTVSIDTIRAVPRSGAAAMLTVAPSVFLTQSGGDGHPNQIFLRGFDARHGQDVEFTVEGVPLNDTHNPHGHGLADIHFLIPEAVRTVKVVEGPFSPSQGDFAVAGSAAYALGLSTPGLITSATIGSFGTTRAMVGWRPADASGTSGLRGDQTFFAGEVFRTTGWGENRGAIRGSGLMQLVGGASPLRWRLLAGVYGSAYDSAGLVRKDDVDAGRIDLYGTYDTKQGGSSQRALISGGLEGKSGDTEWSLMAFAGARGLRIRENYNGFLLDERRPGETDHPQRGDLLEALYSARQAGLRAVARQAFASSVGDYVVEAGFFGRYDAVNAGMRRLRDQNGTPYRVEIDALVDHLDAAPWADIAGTWGIFAAHAGARVEGLVYETLDACAAKDGWFPGIEQNDVNCPDEDRYGPRLRDEARTAFGIGLGPRASIEVNPSDHWSITASAGRGLRSLEAISLGQDESATFASADSAEIGVIAKQPVLGGTAQVRLIGFTTHVNRDLVFDEEQGRNVVAGETWRYGGLVSSELYVQNLVARTSFTYTYAIFGDDIPTRYSYYNSDRVPGMLIPYVPPYVVRSDVSYTWDAGRADAKVGRWQFSHGVGFDWIGPRPLPQSQRSDAYALVDVGTGVSRGPIQVRLDVTNVFGARYASAEYNFSSYWPGSGAAFPTRVPSRQISAGAPRAVSLTLTLRPGTPKAAPDEPLHGDPHEEHQEAP